MIEWSAAQYRKFESERELPSLDLVCTIPLRRPESVVDIGCGTGTSTAVLCREFPGARIVGVDNSENMLAAARKALPDVEFRQMDVSQELDSVQERFALVFSNACLQWIPDHPRLLAGLAGLLREGGVLAVQIPQQAKQPVRLAMEALAAEDRWKDRMPAPVPSNVRREEEYFDILSGLFRDFRIWETTYCHAMPSHKAVLEWYKGTALRPYLAALAEGEKEEFSAELLKEIEKLYPVQAHGEILFRFPRLFFVAVK